jgi:hypothetical protein
MCNFELDTEAFRLRRVEMIALADQRRLARALKPVRAGRAPVRRRLRIPVSSPLGLKPSPLPR